MTDSSTLSQHKSGHQPYRVTTEEMTRSLEWLEKASKTEEYYVHSYLGGQRSEVREGRFNEHIIPEIIDSDVISKYNKALTLGVKKSNH